MIVVLDDGVMLLGHVKGVYGEHRHFAIKFIR